MLAFVYNVKGKTWIATSEPVESIQQGKAKAEAYAKAYLNEILKVGTAFARMEKFPLDLVISAGRQELASKTICQVMRLVRS